MTLLISPENIENRILLLRERRGMLDSDLAEPYGVPTRRLNEQVRRNLERFPEDFMFQLTEEERIEVVANCDHLKKIKHFENLPYAFTEYGPLMLANVLKSPRAVEASIQVVRAFVMIRKFILDHEALARKLEILEKKYDRRFKVVFDAIRELMDPKFQPSKQLGFQQKRTARNLRPVLN